MLIDVASLVLMAAVLVVAAVSVTARRGLRSGVWRFPLAVSLATGFFGLTVWLSITSDNALQHWGDEALADEWQAEVRSHVSEMAHAVFPGSELELLPDFGPLWCASAVSQNFYRSVWWDVTNAVPVPTGKVAEARSWLLDSYPSYTDPYTAQELGWFSVKTARGGRLTLVARSGSEAPTIWWDSPCIGTKRAWWLPVSQIAFIVAIIADAGFMVLWRRHRLATPKGLPGPTT